MKWTNNFDSFDIFLSQILCFITSFAAYMLWNCSKVCVFFALARSTQIEFRLNACSSYLILPTRSCHSADVNSAGNPSQPDVTYISVRCSTESWELILFWYLILERTLKKMDMRDGELFSFMASQQTSNYNLRWWLLERLLEHFLPFPLSWFWSLPTLLQNKAANMLST